MEKKSRSSAFWEGIVLFLLSTYGIVMSLISHRNFSVEWKLSPYLFPLIISLFLFVLSLTLIVKKGEQSTKEKSKSDWKTLILFSLVSSVYLLVFSFLGFIISTILLLAAVMVILGERRLWFILAVSVVSSVAVYLLFAKYLSVMLPKGRVFWYLGL
ncbi:MAG: tripartite tricarboxylate transporter TctB family protein [Candidatus Ornithospirochaeta sp.]